MILDDIRRDREERLEAEKRRMPLVELKARISGGDVLGGGPRDFRAPLAGDGVNIIAEVKKASPSKGVIREDFDPLSIALSYEEAGAACVSVLTEEKFFLGSLDYLSIIKQNISLPVLRKDFLFDPYQLYEARVAGADAILLICAMLDGGQLRDLMGLATELGMSSLVEVHSEAELTGAITNGVGEGAIVGINNRNLKTFVTDIDTTVRLLPLVPEGALSVSESGINTPGDIASLRSAGADAFLIGEALVRESDERAKLKEFLGESSCDD